MRASIREIMRVVGFMHVFLLVREFKFDWTHLNEWAYTRLLGFVILR